MGQPAHDLVRACESPGFPIIAHVHGAIKSILPRSYSPTPVVALMNRFDVTPNVHDGRNGSTDSKIDRHPVWDFEIVELAVLSTNTTILLCCLASVLIWGCWRSAHCKQPQPVVPNNKGIHHACHWTLQLWHHRYARRDSNVDALTCARIWDQVSGHIQDK